jgi:hypothetical protein
MKTKSNVMIALLSLSMAGAVVAAEQEGMSGMSGMEGSKNLNNVAE